MQFLCYHLIRQSYNIWWPGSAGATNPDSKVHGANMGPIGGRQDLGGPHAGPMNFVIWVYTQ